MVEGAIRHGSMMKVEGNYVDTYGHSEKGSRSPVYSVRSASVRAVLRPTPGEAVSPERRDHL
jgi:hypothetical protein